MSLIRRKWTILRDEIPCIGRFVQSMIQHDKNVSTKSHCNSAPHVGGGNRFFSRPAIHVNMIPAFWERMKPA